MEHGLLWSWSIRERILNNPNPKDPQTFHVMPCTSVCVKPTWLLCVYYLIVQHMSILYILLPVFSSRRCVMRKKVQKSKLLPPCLFWRSDALIVSPPTPTSSLVDWVASVWSLHSGCWREEPANWCWLPDQASGMVRHNNHNNSNINNNNCICIGLTWTRLKSALQTRWQKKVYF